MTIDMLMKELATQKIRHGGSAEVMLMFDGEQQVANIRRIAPGAPPDLANYGDSRKCVYLLPGVKLKASNLDD